MGLFTFQISFSITTSQAGKAAPLSEPGFGDLNLVLKL